MRPSSLRITRATPRRGAVMVLALVALAVAAALAAAVLRSALLARRALHTEHDLRQIERLLVAGADAARARAETGGMRAWELVVAPAELAGSGSARLAVVPLPGSASELTLVVEYPLEGPLTIRRSRTVVLPSTSASNREESSP
ncbi:MAG: hypothetical protein ACKO35_14435 [Planctomycetaceae bacterium]